VNGDGGVARERIAAVALLAVSVAAAAWIHCRVAEVGATVEARREQLDSLRSLCASRPQLEDRGESSLEPIDGLFDGHELAWLRTAAGPVLTLRAGGVAR
jgi:hypothetical protein